jgi:HD-GYP domain-containing protein (c-di-GMP phosphodiesterase class II)
MLLLADWRHPSCGLARPEVAGFLEALSGTAAIALENQSLLEGRKKLLHAVIRMVADAIDAKSPYTGRHCRRVPELARSLAQAADAATEGPFADFHLDLADWEALDIAAWLHDCGKLTTPEYVLDKATKLETLYNRIHEIRVRFEVLKRDAEVSYWRGLAQGQDEALLRRERDQAWQSLDGDFAFVAHCNLGTEQISAEDKDRLAAIARRTWQRTLDDRLGLSQMELARKQGNAILPATEHLLANHPEHLVERNPGILQDAQKFSMKVPEHLCHLGELHNLSVAHGTLTEEERFKIEEHIIQTITMLANLPFPPDLAAVPEMAGGHHEAMDGSGYPRGLRREQMSVPARIMAIADVFEALTAADRPYKAHLPVAEALAIMARMRDEDKLDGDLFALFLESGVWRDYAARHLPEPTGDMDVRQYLTRKLVRHVS